MLGSLGGLPSGVSNRGENRTPLVLDSVIPQIHMLNLNLSRMVLGMGPLGGD